MLLQRAVLLDMRIVPLQKLRRVRRGDDDRMPRQALRYRRRVSGRDRFQRREVDQRRRGDAVLSKQDSDSGLTEQEKEVLKLLGDAPNAFSRLLVQHESDGIT